MSEEDKVELTHVAFAVLGLVDEYPCHGKDINQRIEERGMRNWTAIGKSSIYSVLKNLKERGLVESWVGEEDNRIVKFYQTTPKGKETLKRKIFTVLNEFMGRSYHDFYVAFSMLNLLSPEELIEAITNSRSTIIKFKNDLEAMLKKNANMPLTVTGLFIHPIKILQTDIEFLEWLLEEIKKGGSQIDPEAYSK